jgi:hypothetical protein
MPAAFEKGGGAAVDSSPLAKAMEWVARITTVAVMMVMPGVGGWWLDGRLGTTYFVAIGFGLGLVMGLVFLLRVVRPPGGPSARRPSDSFDESKSSGKSMRSESSGEGK